MKVYLTNHKPNNENKAKLNALDKPTFCINA